MKTQLKIQLLGSSFSIQTDESKEHVEDVLECLTKKIEEVLDKNAGIEPVKIALLAALNLADELIQLKKKVAGGVPPSPKPDDEIEKITGHLIQRIDDALAGSGGQPPAEE
jgi:cell division protein ZapA